MSIALYGIGICNKIEIGNVHWLRSHQPEIFQFKISEHHLKHEEIRYQNALKATRNHFSKIRERLPPASQDIDAFIDTHLLMLDDASLSNEPIKLIHHYQCNAEWALKLQHENLMAVFNDINDPYLRARKDDVYHVVSQIQSFLLNQHSTTELLMDQHFEGFIIFANDLSPAEMALLQQQNIAGFVTEHGGPLSHTAILARSLDIAAIVGLNNSHHFVKQQELVILDSQQGVVIVAPDADSLAYYKNRQRQLLLRRRELDKLKSRPAISQDGQLIALLANVELPEDVQILQRIATGGIGLYRTEFLYMNTQQPPDEEQQYQVYRQLMEQMQGLPVTIRTLDLGADKQVDGGRRDIPLATNPALGLRAIRLCLRDPKLFHPQLRAILRASAFGSVRILIPMLTNVQELLQVLKLIDEMKRQLKQQGLAFDPNIPIGGMIEVPAAAVTANLFAEYLDFFSIGTNDLIQYTLAIDRVDDAVNYLYDPLHPAVLKLIKMTIDAGRKAQIPVAMCGEMAGDSRYTQLLLGLGLTEFSMHPSALLEIKEIIHRSHIQMLQQQVPHLLNYTHSQQIADELAKISGQSCH